MKNNMKDNPVIADLLANRSSERAIMFVLNYLTTITPDLQGTNGMLKNKNIWILCGESKAFRELPKCLFSNLTKNHKSLGFNSVLISECVPGSVSCYEYEDTAPAVGQFANTEGADNFYKQFVDFWTKKNMVPDIVICLESLVITDELIKHVEQVSSDCLFIGTKEDNQ